MNCMVWYRTELEEGTSICLTCNKRHRCDFVDADMRQGSSNYVRGASKIKLKSMFKMRMATARRLIFLEFLKASIAGLVTLLFSSLQNSEGSGNGDSGDSFADPCQFYHFRRPKFNFQLLSFTFETFDKKLAETKIIARVIVKKIKAKK
jgi:hypothetical protein